MISEVKSCYFEGELSSNQKLQIKVLQNCTHCTGVLFVLYRKNAEDYAWTVLLVKSVFITAWRTFLESSEDYENKFSLAFLQF